MNIVVTWVLAVVTVSSVVIYMANQHRLWTKPWGWCGGTLVAALYVFWAVLRHGAWVSVFYAIVAVLAVRSAMGDRQEYRRRQVSHDQSE